MSKTWYIETRVGSENHRGECVRFIDDRRGSDGEYINMPAEQKMAELMRAGEWQTERPTNGEWWVSIHPDKRHKFGKGAHWPAPVCFEGPCHQYAGSCRLFGFHFQIGEGGTAADMFTGALWQRRAVPKDPFKRGEG